MSYFLSDVKTTWYLHKYFVFGKFAITIIPKCGCSTLSALYLLQNNISNGLITNEDISLKDYEYAHLHDLMLNDPWPVINQYRTAEEDLPRELVRVAIYRDPLDRFLSAKNVCDKNCTLEEFVEKTLDTFDNISFMDIDQHLLPQNLFYIQNKIDIFVNVKNLIPFLKYIGYDMIAINQRTFEEKKKMSEEFKNIIEKYKEKLKFIYKEDFKLINNIPIEKEWIC